MGAFPAGILSLTVNWKFGIIRITGYLFFYGEIYVIPTPADTSGQEGLPSARKRKRVLQSNRGKQPIIFANPDMNISLGFANRYSKLLLKVDPRYVVGYSEISRDSEILPKVKCKSSGWRETGTRRSGRGTCGEQNLKLLDLLLPAIGGKSKN